MPTLATDPLEFWSQLYAGAGGFRESYVTSGSDPGDGEDFGSWEARRNRYRAYWGHYENNVYRKIHRWAGYYKEDYGLYAFIRSIYSPAHRIGEFWAEHLMGGSLPDALPIVAAGTDGVLNPAIIPTIERIWRESTWQVHKETWTRFGAVLGDVGLMAVDDVPRQRCYLKVVHPGTIKELKQDVRGNVRNYVIQETRPDPRPIDERPEGLVGTGRVVYSEFADRVGDSVHYRTYLNDDLYDWREYPDGTLPAEEIGPEWWEPYGFVPLVVVRHRDVSGTGWGWSETHQDLSKLHEVDDLASKLHDHMRIAVEAPWAFFGATPDEMTVKIPPPDPRTPEAGRSRIPTLWFREANGRAQALIAPLDATAMAAEIRGVLTEIERDHPELQADIATASGDASGRALREARKRATARVIARRAGYDDALVRAHMMALSIGGMKQYPGYEAFDAGSYARGELAHSIGPRPVYDVDVLDRLEEERERSLIVGSLTQAGVPLATALQRVGYSEAEVAAVLADRDAEATAQLETVRRNQALQFADIALPDGEVGGDGAVG